MPKTYYFQRGLGELLSSVNIAGLALLSPGVPSATSMLLYAFPI